MVKKFSVPCNFGGQQSPVTLYIGEPNPEKHPLNFQSAWLSSEKGGQVPQDIMDSIAKIRDLALQNNVSFEELCYYAINIANGTIPNDNAKFAGLLEQL